MLTSCAATNGTKAIKPQMDRAKFDHYYMVVNASDAKNGSCIYGPYELVQFTEITNGRETGGGGAGLWDVFKELHCKWESMDGTPHEEKIDMGKLLLPKYVEWEHFKGEQLLENVPSIRNAPLEIGPEYSIKIKGKEFKIIRRFNVLLYGEKLSEHSGRIKSTEVIQIIYERNH